MVFLMSRPIALIFSAIILLATTSLPALAVPRRPLTLQDQTKSDPSFAKFVGQLRQIVADRNGPALTKILPTAGISIGFSRPTTIPNLNLSNPNARIWKILDYTLAHTCGRSNVPASKDWVCPTIAKDFGRQYPEPGNANTLEYLTRQVIVLGQNVNVRSQPNLTGTIIGQLSNEVVSNDPPNRGTYDANDPRMGWTAVRLNDGRSGYVNNRYVYFLLGYQLDIQPVNNVWKLMQINAGE
jgi:hypothetical protein